MDGIEHFYTHDSDFVGMTFLDELRARLFLIETPYKSVMIILRLVSYKVKKFDTLICVTRATKYYNKLIEEETYETDRYEIAQRQKLIRYFYESHYKSCVLKLLDGGFKADITKRMSYSDYLLEIEDLVESCKFGYIDTLVSIFNIDDPKFLKIIEKRQYLNQTLDSDDICFDTVYKARSKKLWTNCDHDNYTRFLQIIQKAYPDIEKQRAMIALYKDSERKMKMCKTQEELRETFEVECKFLDYYTKDGHFTYLYELFRKQSFKLSGLQVNLNFDRLILRSDYEAELVRLATNTTSLPDFSFIVQLFVMRFNKEMDEIEQQTNHHVWSEFFNQVDDDLKKFNDDTVRILEAHEDFLFEEVSKRYEEKRQNPDYHAKKIYNLLCDEPGNYEDMHARAMEHAWFMERLDEDIEAH